MNVSFEEQEEIKRAIETKLAPIEEEGLYLIARCGKDGSWTVKFTNNVDLVLNGIDGVLGNEL